MISDAQRYYGCVLLRLVERADCNLSIRNIGGGLSGFFLIQGNKPLYIKYSTKRYSPWNFTFHKEHQLKQRELFETFGGLVTAFVCGKDGIVALPMDAFRTILDDNFETQEAVSIKRRHNQMYSIRGRDGILDRRTSRSSLEDCFFD